MIHRSCSPDKFRDQIALRCQSDLDRACFVRVEFRRFDHFADIGTGRENRVRGMQ